MDPQQGTGDKGYRVRRSFEKQSREMTNCRLFKVKIGVTRLD